MTIETSLMKVDCMSEEYGKPAVTPLAYDFDGSRLDLDQNAIVLTRMDVLGIVQSAFDEVGPVSERMIAVKREVLEAVSNGELAKALRTAIVGASKVSGE